MLEFQAGEIEAAALAPDEEGTPPAREGPPGQRRAPGRALGGGLHPALRRRGGGPRPARPGVPARGGPGGHRPRAFGPTSRPGPACRPARGARPAPAGLQGRPRGGSRASRRDRVAPGPHRAAEAEVRRVGRGGAGLRGAVPQRAGRARQPGGAGGRPSRSGASARRPYLEQARALSRRRRRGGRRRSRSRCRPSSGSWRWRRRGSRSPSPRSRPEEAEAPAHWTERGLERAEFLLSPNPGEELRPLARIASGGELSRIMLALKSVVHGDSPGVDARLRRGGRRDRRAGGRGRGPEAQGGVGPPAGPVRDAPAADRRARRRAPGGAQERGRGAHAHHRRALSPADRAEEIARMLGGEVVTDTARQHAREMLKHSLR